jgi:hypothetical protein
MNQYSQNDPKWASKRMGNSSTTIGRSGCFITSLAMFCGKTPDVVNDMLTKGGGYGNGGLLNSEKASAILGIPYHGRTTAPQNTACIAETNNYAPSYPQHFFVWLGDGNIIDSLNGQKKKNPYHIVSYRLFQPINQGEDMSVRTEIDKPALAKSKQMAFINTTDTGDDIQDYFNTLYGGKPLGDWNVTAFIDYMWKHPNRKKAMDAVAKLKTDNAALQQQVKDLQAQVGGGVDKPGINALADQIKKKVGY